MSFRSAREDTAPLHLTHDRYERSRPDKTNPLAMMDFLVRLVEGRSLTEAVLISTGSTSIKQTDLHVCAVRQDRDATRSSAHMPVTTRLRQVCALLLSYYPQIGPADDAV